MNAPGEQRSLLTDAICASFDDTSFAEWLDNGFSEPLGPEIPPGALRHRAHTLIRHCEHLGTLDELHRSLARLRGDNELARTYLRKYAPHLIASAPAAEPDEPRPEKKHEPATPPVASERPKSRLRWYSTLASSNRGEISVLAVVETVLSVALYAGIAVWFDTVRHIVIAAVLAPLWLLRTKGSVRLGMSFYLSGEPYFRGRWLELFGDSLDSLDRQLGSWAESRIYIVARIPLMALWLALFICLFFLWILSVILLCWMIRLVATTVAVVRHPLIHFVAIRKNWKRLVLATDVVTIPEWLPGAEYDGRLKDIYPLGVRRLINVSREESQTAPRWAIALSLLYTLVAFIPLIYLIPLLLRTAVKGVSILYTPMFLVITSDPINRGVALGKRLVEMQHDNVAFLKRCVAVTVIALFLIAVLLPGPVARWHNEIRIEGSAVFVLLAEYFVPRELKFWVLVNALNGVLCLYLSWVYAQKADRRLREGGWTTRQVRTFLNGWIGFQMLLSIFAIVCAVAIFANYYLYHQPPARGWQWFPNAGW
jgi:hypothetical protein